ncbi:hypothetical protein [Mucilaginibacter arboris]|uniref:J domain-containing protein n=1 Tax=Mucilaginibacter arboris TaxID=2682090 RepID=A0A7K1T0U9_9SPHI|nr:hypothetical protein [Mucilaginibacter arboris]MVN23193.1 hypothetical protein [Mucilaginibacter arboris]
MLFPTKTNIYADETVKVLEREIAALEAELIELETEVNVFQLQIQSALSTQIHRIQELTVLYKNQKQAKKLKRLEQKKRGKNYREPVSLKTRNASFTAQNLVSADDRQELKRLYKEAIVQIHPDKFVDADNELNERATAVTVKLNEVYKSGDLEELNRLHEHIISGNALTYVPDRPKTINDLSALMLFLQQKKQKLQHLLQEIKTSAIYKLFESRKDIRALIQELKIQFEERIVVLEKRTK